MNILDALFGWLTGPIFGKELRTSSRRRRNYVLRFVYLLLLTLFVVVAWLANVHTQTYQSAAYNISRLPEAGKQIVMWVVWFQFITVQLVAVILLSNAVSDEVYHRTLAVLMTTPISAWQIVIGKLLSKLWQLILLLAISLPLLAVVRVFGGVPWEFVLSGLCITLTACLALGSVSLFFSVVLRRAWASILVTLGTAFVLYLVLPWMIMLLMLATSGFDVDESYMMMLVYASPPGAMAYGTIEMMSPGGVPVVFYWPLHCGIMVLFSAGVLALSMLLVRRLALRLATGDTAVVDGPAAPVPPPLKPPPAAPGPDATGPPLPAPPEPLAEPLAGTIRRVTGSPVLWRELRRPLTRSIVKKVLGITIPAVLLGSMYAFCWGFEWMDAGGPHVFFICMYLIAGILMTTVMSATTITTEKETGSWPLLLSTTVENFHIVAAKAAGVVRRTWIVWALLAAHVLLSVLFGVMHPVLMVLLPMVIGGTVLFLTGMGMFVSSLMRRSTAAVIICLGLVLAIWVVAPILFALVSQIDFVLEGLFDELSDAMVYLNPVGETAILIGGAGGESNASEPLTDLAFDWEGLPYDMDVVGTFVLVAVVAGGYGLLGLFAAAGAAATLRRRIYGA